MDSKLWILLNPVTDRVHKHSETALDCPTQDMAVREIPWFYGRSRKNDRPIRKIAGFYG